MKKFLLISTLFSALILRAQDVTLDVTKIIENSHIEFNDLDVWTETYNDSVIYREFGDNIFKFSHIPSGESYDGLSWEGFTISKSADTTLAHATFYPNYQWSCMAGGGIDGEGEPFIVGYYSEYIEDVMGIHACEISFEKESVVAGVYICGTTYTAKSILENGAYTRKFGTGDYCTLTAHGLDAEGNDNGRSITYYIADYRDTDSTKWTLNKGWEWMPLEELGEVKGVYFTMTTTDINEFGSNTPLYFAIDKMRITPIEKTAIKQISSDLNLFISNNILHINNTGNKDVTIYNIAGEVVFKGKDYKISIEELRQGVYIVRCGNMVNKFIKK